MATVRKKFIGYALPDGEFRETTAGLPAPILESVDTLKKHLYESLGEVQVRREEEIARYPLTVGELDEEAVGSFAETLYRAMLPSLPQYLISLLKLLLASISSVKSKTDGPGVAVASAAAAANVITEVGGSIQVSLLAGLFNLLTTFLSILSSVSALLRGGSHCTALAATED